jgi:transposase InsO family protein
MSFFYSVPPTFLRPAEARIMVREAIEIYNTRRPHLSLEYKTPDAVHRAFFDP